MSKKETRDAMRELQKRGWRFTLSGSGHWRGEHPKAHRPIYISATPSSPRTRDNARADARRALRGRPA